MQLPSPSSRLRRHGQLFPPSAEIATVTARGGPPESGANKTPDLLLYFIFFGSVMVLSDCYSWANEQFGHARLGDPRRTRRLVSLASSLAQHAGLSIVKSSQSTAQVEGAYRLIRNPSVSPQAIAEAGFTATVRACGAHPLLLALEDTTTINFSHSTASDDRGKPPPNPKARGRRAPFS